MFPEWYARQPQTMLIKKTGEHVPMKATNFARPKHGAVVAISPAEATRLERYFATR